MYRPSGDPSDVIVCIVEQAYKDTVKGNGHSAAAREFLMDDEWVTILGVSPETVQRIRDSLPKVTP